MSTSNLPGKEQIGFRPNHSTIDHCMVLAFLAEKYTHFQGGKLYVAFIDLCKAFDSIDRQLLWMKLQNWGIDQRLLFLLRKFHSQNTCQVRFDSKGSLTPKILVGKGVKQGCILAPSLFNLFLADLPAHLTGIEGHAPILNTNPIPILLYADDALVLSRSKIGLKRYLKAFSSYCTMNCLNINFNKSKILIFSKSQKILRWRFEGQEIEQV